jgi:hypothetical protein
MIATYDEKEPLLIEEYIKIDEDKKCYPKIRGYFKCTFKTLFRKGHDEDSIYETARDYDLVISIFIDLKVDPFIIVMGIYNYFKICNNLPILVRKKFMEDAINLAACLHMVAKYSLEEDYKYEENPEIAEYLKNNMRSNIKNYSRLTVKTFNEIERNIYQLLDYRLHIRYDDIKPMIDRVLGMKVDCYNL